MYTHDFDKDEDRVKQFDIVNADKLYFDASHKRSIINPDLDEYDIVGIEHRSIFLCRSCHSEESRDQMPRRQTLGERYMDLSERLKKTESDFEELKKEIQYKKSNILHTEKKEI